MSKKNNKYKCPKGLVERDGYYRKGYQRNKYTRKNGTVIPATYVSAAIVPPTCIYDYGKTEKGPKTLPKPGDKIRLSRYGYNIHKPQANRRAALRAAINDNNTLVIYKRLNLLRNFQHMPENKEIFTQDVEYLKKLYSKIRRTKPNQRGGDDALIAETSETSDNMMDIIKVKATFNRQKNCDNSGNCSIINIVHETHLVNGKQISYDTLEEKDADQILELDKLYLDSGYNKTTVLQKITDNRGLLIGIKIDDKLQGYCQYKPIDETGIKIIWFCANKGFGTPLYIFLEKYFKLNAYTKIILTVSLEGQHSTRRINFWYTMGFSAYETLPENKKIRLEKNIYNKN